MKYIATSPETEPLTLDDVKMHLRTLPGNDAEDTSIIMPLITAAREYCENITGRALATQIIKAYPDEFKPVIRLPHPPIISVESVKYTDENGTKTMDTNEYVVDDENIAFINIPTYKSRSLDPIEITYTAGYEVLPSSVRQAMLLLIGHWYFNREAVVVGAVTSVELQISVDRLLNQYKVWWF